MAGLTQFERDKLTALEGIREALRDAGFAGRDNAGGFVETLCYIGDADGDADDGIDFGTGAAVTKTFQVPTGYKAKVLGVSLYNNLETFTAGASVEFGDGSDADAYAETEAIPTGTTPIKLVVTNNADIPGGSTVTVTFNPTGGTPTGISAVAIVLGYTLERS